MHTCTTEKTGGLSNGCKWIAVNHSDCWFGDVRGLGVHTRLALTARKYPSVLCHDVSLQGGKNIRGTLLRCDVSPPEKKTSLERVVGELTLDGKKKAHYTNISNAS